MCLEYLRHFAPRAQAVVHHRRFRTILAPAASSALFQLLLDPPLSFRASLILGALRHGRLPDSAGSGRLYLNIGHTGLDSGGFRRWVAASDVRPVYFVHDLIPLTHPQFCRAGEADKHRERMRTVLTSAAGVIANSQATLNDLETFARGESLTMPPGIAAWLGAGRIPERSHATPPARPTFVVLGTIEARKNHLMLLNLWAKLVRRDPAGAPQLLVIGQRGWEADEAFEMLDNREDLRGHVIELGKCSDDELARHLANARALLFPSHAEGYGLPLVEALRMAVPVIASDLPAFREIGQGVPMFIDPNDEAAWEKAILEFSRPENGARRAQLERLRGFEAPTWTQHFQRVEQFLGRLRPGPAARSSSRSGQ